LVHGHLGVAGLTSLMPIAVINFFDKEKRLSPFFFFSFFFLCLLSNF
jgi:hypothetical protein